MINQSVTRCPACKREYSGAEIVCAHDGTILLTITTDRLIGTTLADKYLVLSEIGRGGMSIVYKGKDIVMDRVVAIKMLQAQLAGDPTSRKRFQQEAQAVSCLAHPNVIGVFDFGIAPTEQPYLVMDFLVGESLADIIQRDSHIPEGRAIWLFMQACDALEHAHQKGVIHRDLKSSNIMIVDDDGHSDVIKVVDFGIAKFMPSSGMQAQNLTQTGEVFGSPIYMSPEQCLGHPMDARSDIYSMGVLMYEALTGYPPLMGHTIVDTMQMHVGTTPEPFAKMRSDLVFTSALETVVLRALEKNPANRFASMRSFFGALAQTQKLLPTGGVRQPLPADNELAYVPAGRRITPPSQRMPRARSRVRSDTDAIEDQRPDTLKPPPSVVQEGNKGNLLPVFITVCGIAVLFLLVTLFFIFRPH